MTQQDPEEMTEAQLREEVKRLRGELQAERSGLSRRSVVRGGLSVAGLAALLFASDPAAAVPSGTFPESSSPALHLLRANQVRFVPRASNPSDPSPGEMWVLE